MLVPIASGRTVFAAVLATIRASAPLRSDTRLRAVKVNERC